MNKKQPPKSPLSAKSKEDYRLLADRVLSQAARGRMTLEMLRDVASLLIHFSGCDAVEAMYRERRRFFHCDARRGETPPFFCAVTRMEGAPDLSLFYKLHNAPAEVDLRGLFDPPSAVQGPKRRAYQGRFWRRSDETAAPAPDAFGALAVFPLTFGMETRGVLGLFYREAMTIPASTMEQLSEAMAIIGLALSHNQAQFELRERVKELMCMYGIADLAAKSHQPMAFLLGRIVRLLPPAYLYPEITEARIVFDKSSYETPGFRESDFMQRADLVVGEAHRGRVEVAYLESRPELDEGPFLDEERHLIDSVAREVALLIERRQAEKEQEKLQEQLRHADRLATIGQLSAGMAHEINEPLTGILGFAELLKDTPAMPEQALADIGRIETAALHAREIVRKLLLFARQIPPKRKPVDVNAIVEEVLSFFRVRLARQNIRTECRLTPALPAIYADEAQIRQVAVNLVVNAVQAMTGGGALTVVTEQRENEIRLAVQDTGVGMSDAVREKIFLPFFSTKEVGQGTGLGLSVVHGIVKSHHGRIDVASQPGQGSTFVVVLPVLQEDHGR
ncbi:MAG: hypothetical protein C4523_20230 [Myxococcales bacterium]|nr:MAG: hypothetical protein C4523_20230 [Myxococcales bacterium]